MGNHFFGRLRRTWSAFGLLLNHGSHVDMKAQLAELRRALDVCEGEIAARDEQLRRASVAIDVLRARLAAVTAAEQRAIISNDRLLRKLTAAGTDRSPDQAST